MIEMESLKKILGREVFVKFLLQNDDVVAYAWHYTEEKALNHLRRIMDYHLLEGSVLSSRDLEEWLAERLREVLIEGERFRLPEIEYKNKRVYIELIKVPHGETITYGELSKRAGTRYHEVLIALMRNPLQVLIPCHRLLTKKGTLMGFYPLGKEVKKRLLEMEGVHLEADGNE